MSSSIQELDAEVARATESIMASANRLAVTARFMERPMFMAQLCAAVKSGITQHLSGWLDPAAAADYSFSSEGFVYQMADAGVIHRYGGENMPRFKKSEIDAAIESGRWQGKNSKHQASSIKGRGVAE